MARKSLTRKFLDCKFSSLSELHHRYARIKLGAEGAAEAVPGDSICATEQQLAGQRERAHTHRQVPSLSGHGSSCDSSTRGAEGSPLVERDMQLGHKSLHAILISTTIFQFWGSI
eukprot:3864359-Amphidinium_carterae.1